MKLVDIYVGSVTIGNPGVGAWASTLVYGGQEKELGATSTKTTAAKIQLESIIESLEALKEPCIVNMHIKPSQVSKALQSKYIDKRKLTKFKGMHNKQLWEKLYTLYNYHVLHMILANTGKNLNSCLAKAEHLAQEALDKLRDNCEAEFESEAEAYRFADENSLEIVNCNITEYGVKAKYRVKIRAGIEGKKQTVIPEMVKYLEEPKNFMVGTNTGTGMMLVRKSGVTFRPADAMKFTKNDATKKAISMTRVSKQGYTWVPIKAR